MQFIENLFRSLETEMRKGFAEIRQDMDERFSQIGARLDQTNARMDRIGGLVDGGARAMAKVAEWSERTDGTTADLLRRVAELDQRLRKLEGGGNSSLK